jgi:hypothetical protein
MPDPTWWARACELHAAGLNFTQIAKQMNRSRSAVRMAVDPEYRRKRYDNKYTRVGSPREPAWWEQARKLRRYGHAYYRTRSYAEIGRILGVPASSVRYALKPAFRQTHKARKRRFHAENREEQNYKRKLHWALSSPNPGG